MIVNTTVLSSTSRNQSQSYLRKYQLILIDYSGLLETIQGFPEIACREHFNGGLHLFISFAPITVYPMADIS
jgi:hypothetical protein